MTVIDLKSLLDSDYFNLKSIKGIADEYRTEAFFGTFGNAVKTQVWIAISVYVLLAIIKKGLNPDLNLYTILQIMSVACSTALEMTSYRSGYRAK